MKTQSRFNRDVYKLMINKEVGPNTMHFEIFPAGQQKWITRAQVGLQNLPEVA